MDDTAIDPPLEGSWEPSVPGALVLPSGRIVRGGRTGTALACLVVLEGRSGAEAVDYVREHYHRRAVETVWQRRYVAGFQLRS